MPQDQDHEDQIPRDKLALDFYARLNEFIADYGKETNLPPWTALGVLQLQVNFMTNKINDMLGLEEIEVPTAKEAE